MRIVKWLGLGGQFGHWKLVIGISFVILVWSLVILAGCAPSGKTEPQKKVLFYRNPMNPEITSPVPRKDEMGMDYVPVYEEKIPPKGEVDLSKETNIVRLSEEEEKIIGVQAEPAARRKLAKEIRTVGIVAYDPDLYVAQEEFVGALKLNDADLVETSRKRLRILGMSEEQIAGLERSGEPQSNLLLPEGKVWVYANFYEYEAAWLKEGARVAVRSTADPAEEYPGRVAALEPIVKGETRTIQAKIEVDNPKLALKPNMYVDVYLKAELPAALAVPSEAVLDTGIRKLVYVDKGEGIYVGREVKTGPEASGYIPILAGVSPGEKVVSKANFLIDSQSKLTGGASALYGGAAKEVNRH